MLAWLVVAAQALLSIGGLIYWTKRDDLESIAKQIQGSRDPYLLSGNYSTKSGRKQRRALAKHWIADDTEYAAFFGIRSIFWGVGIVAALFLYCYLAQTLIMFLNGSAVNLDLLISLALSLAIALLDAATFDLFFLVGQSGEFRSEIVEARASTFVFLLSELLIVSAIIAYIGQSIVSWCLVKMFPVHVYWAATDSRDHTRKRGFGERTIRFLMDFHK